MTAPVDWSRWRKCPVCNAGIGQPCAELTGYVHHGVTRDVVVELGHPHKTRKPRTGGTT